MVQIPRGALFAGALALSDGRTRGVVALASFVASVRDGVTAGGDSGSTGAPRDAPAGVTFVVDDGVAAAAVDDGAVAPAVGQWEP